MPPLLFGFADGMIAFEGAEIGKTVGGAGRRGGRNRAHSQRWTPKFRPVVKLVFSRSAPCEREQIDETKTQTI
jgi:hypothetical protein